MDVINTLLQEQKKFQFEDIFAATQRLRALWRAIAEHRLEEWTAGKVG